MPDLSRYDKYKDFEGPSGQDLYGALRKWNDRKMAMAVQVAEVIISGGQQKHTSERHMKHKHRLNGVPIK